MAFIRTLRSALRRGDDQLAQDIVETGTHRDHRADATASVARHGSQGIRPYGFGY
ncbi:hypothetical protein [Brachybacterium sp. GU-2]|uniref:hypothetical protein n=1 Tax=Brachybacterium sp. GU-2 TaxID=3069708 RepID=UPI00280C1430|nr:hypothetical protein [Brachybacterium sp. GU-2]WME23500.1 hypothetical protein RBL05_01760 [Brachybacterium sp. GU-2]